MVSLAVVREIWRWGRRHDAYRQSRRRDHVQARNADPGRDLLEERGSTSFRSNTPTLFDDSSRPELGQVSVCIIGHELQCPETLPREDNSAVMASGDGQPLSLGKLRRMLG